MRPELPVLIKARALIAEPARWGKGIRGICADRPVDTYCAAEAIEEVARTRGLRHRACKALHSAANPSEHPVVAIWQWNDAPERNHAEVLAAFDKAIEAAS